MRLTAVWRPLPPPLLSLDYRRTATVGSPSGREPRQSRGLSVEELYFLSALRPNFTLNVLAIALEQLFSSWLALSFRRGMGEAAMLRSLKCYNGTNSAVIDSRVGLSVAAAQAEATAAVPTHAEPISGRELTTRPVPSVV